ncbi:hypothetical protein [Frondihabitans sp. 762G35]|uniref:hypothetical protein n=1 Tax=Frondihabitans sp. 762G35 TaxID=1446794 RepID=UPI000F4F6FFB|nr:hypothetical protein [Frondihabitans sp. 762G35]
MRDQISVDRLSQLLEAAPPGPLIAGLLSLLELSPHENIAFNWMEAGYLAGLYGLRQQRIAEKPFLREEGMTAFLDALRDIPSDSQVGLLRVGPRTSFFVGAVAAEKSELLGLFRVENSAPRPKSRV